MTAGSIPEQLVSTVADDAPPSAPAAGQEVAIPGGPLHKIPLKWRVLSMLVLQNAAATLLVLNTLSDFIEEQTEGSYFLLLGSYGALVAILFGAPNSSFAQPRAVIGSNMIAATIAVTTHYLHVPKDAAVAIAPATAIAINQRLGLLHPPAGAAALIFVAAPAGG